MKTLNSKNLETPLNGGNAKAAMGKKTLRGPKFQKLKNLTKQSECGNGLSLRNH